MDTEQWRPIPSAPGYEASNYGHVRSSRCTLRPARRRTGHLQVSLRVNGKSLSRTVHALVAEAWLGPRPDGRQIRHWNGDPADNRPDNLRYGTARQNALDAVRHGTHPQTRKTHCKNGHEFTPENTGRQMRGGVNRGRSCKECARAASIRHRSSRIASLDFSAISSEPFP